MGGGEEKTGDAEWFDRSLSKEGTSLPFSFFLFFHFMEAKLFILCRTVQRSICIVGYHPDLGEREY
jgi:hypothetical protein